MGTTTITYFNNQIAVGHTPVVLIKNIMSSGWIIVTMGGLLLFIVSIIMTHRVAGPAYRIDKSLEKMLKGEFGFPIRLRTKDELKPIASKLEELSFVINSRDKDMKKASEDMNKLINSLQLDEDMKAILRKANKSIIKDIK